LDKDIQRKSYPVGDNSWRQAWLAQSGSTTIPVHELPSLGHVPESFVDEAPAAVVLLPLLLLLLLLMVVECWAKLPAHQLNPNGLDGKYIATAFHPLQFCLL
jgi:hypothetical protein